jgi:integrase
MGRNGAGVEIRPASIRVAFSVGGRSYRETLTSGGRPLAPTGANVKHAHRVVAQIRAEIRAGTFELSRHFPDSPRAQQRPADVQTFGTLAAAWLETKGALSPATLGQYRNAVEVWRGLLGAETPLERLTYTKLATTIGRHPWASAKLFNNYLIPLRGILAMHYRGPLSASHPMIGIENRRVVKRPPDPLAPDERDAILADMRARYDVRVWAYFAAAFYTGMRPEELIALRWSDVDWRRQVVRVQRVRTFKGSEREGTKTGTVRDVDLVPQAIDALKALRPFTELKRDDAGQPVDLFENPVTGRPWHDERSQRDHYWTPTLRRLGIRQRRAYCTRHTYCTAALMAGVAPAYIAAQAGHSTQMLHQVYSRWIPGADGGSQRRLLAQAMAGFAPESPQAVGDE